MYPEWNSGYGAGRTRPCPKHYLFPTLYVRQTGRPVRLSCSYLGIIILTLTEILNDYLAPIIPPSSALASWLVVRRTGSLEYLEREAAFSTKR